MGTQLVRSVIILLLSAASLSAQVHFARENNKWGIMNKDAFIVQPSYDTIYPYDPTGSVCLACHKTRVASNNQFMKVMVTSYACNYFNSKGEKLFVKTSGNDTCSVFSLSKNSLQQYLDTGRYFVASVKGRKYLLTKDFTQHSYKDYQEIAVSNEPMFYVTQIMNEAEMLLTGLVNRKEEIVVPHQYSEIKINTNDSLIIACAAGTRPNAEDDIFNYEGRKIESSRRHIDMATKNYIIHKIYEPREHYISYNIRTREEVQIAASDLKFYQHDEVLIRIRNDWYVYDLKTNQKKQKNKS